MSTYGETLRTSFSAQEKEEVRLELDRILRSSQFQASKRCHDFLDFVVSHALEGDADNLTERFLGADLFGRPLDYDTKTDSIVRVRANDVRRRLADYYSAQRTPPPLTISLSSGSYVPEFHWSAAEIPEPEAPALLPESSPESLTPMQGADGAISVVHNHDSVIGGSGETLSTSSEGLRDLVWRRFAIRGAMAAGIVILALSGLCLALRQELRNAHRIMYPWQNSPVLAEFWGTFLGDPRDTDLVLTDSSYSLIQDLTHKPISLSEYLSRDYTNHLQDRDPAMTAALNRISNWGLGSSGEFEAAQRFLALDPTRRKIHLYVSRKYMPDLMKRDNVILVGSRFGNPWAELFENRMNFTFERDNPNEISNRAPAQGESRTYDYSASNPVGYCIIAYLPNTDHNGSALLIQGTSAEPTQAAVDFLLSDTQMAEFKKKLAASTFPYFELLLKTSWVRGTPIASNIVGYRIYPEK